MLDLDKLAHRAYNPGTECYHQVVRAFAHVEGILLPDSTINRRALGAVCFADAKQMLMLESFVQPAMMEILAAELTVAWQAKRDNIVAVESAVLLKLTELRQQMDQVWVVEVPKSTAVQRLMNRNGFTEEEAKLRVDFQETNDARRAIADEVIVNEDVEATRALVAELLLKIQRRGSSCPNSKV